jgi:lipopolysaccharide/colanic/teichoic acid biosynthesis glycosyltransferase
MQRHLKRAFDFCFAAVGLVLLAPIMAMVALAVLIARGSPVLFRQTRPGYCARPFTLLKFRTMTEARDSYGALLPETQRLTPLGRWLRRLSLDELPQLWNVFKGEMSFVGPRPLLMQYLGRYTADQARRHSVPPGITGWAQINGRNLTSWEERFALDIWYVDRWSLALDFKILLKTFVQVLRGQGIAPQGMAVMPEFAGNAAEGHEAAAIRH